MPKQVNPVVRLGNRRVGPSKLHDIFDSTPLWQAGDLPALRQRLADDGVVLIRGLIPEAVALRARHLLLKTVKDKGAIADRTDYRDGVIAATNKRRLAEGFTVDALSGGATDDRDDDVDGWRKVGHSKAISDIYDGTALESFLKQLFGGEDMFKTLPEYTWLRLKGKGDVTVEHADYYYFKRETEMFETYAENSQITKPSDLCLMCREQVEPEQEHRQCGLCSRPCHSTCMSRTARMKKSEQWHCSDCADGLIYLYTCWICLGDIDLGDSTLAFVPGTHKFTGFDRVRGKEQVPSMYRSLKEPEFHIANQPLHPGDIYLFNIKTVHCASENATNKFRPSIDTRLMLTMKGREFITN